MNVLFLTACPPHPSAFGATAARQAELLRAVALRHRVFVMALESGSSGPVAACDLPELCERLVLVTRGAEHPLARWLSLFGPASHLFATHRPPSGAQALAELVRTEAIDAIVASPARMAGWSLPPGPALLVDLPLVEWEDARLAHELVVGPLERWRTAVEWRAVRREELTALRRADFITAASAEQRDRILAEAPDLEIEIVPHIDGQGGLGPWAMLDALVAAQNARIPA